MSDTYIGVRVELASRIVRGDLETLVEKYNSNNSSQVFDPHLDGKITVERTKELLIARGEKDNRKTKAKAKQGGNINFALMVPVKDTELVRVVQIVNVLGNGRLIRERVKTFMDGQSALNNLPEMKALSNAFVDLDKYMPGLIKGGWYYAPEAKF